MFNAKKLNTQLNEYRFLLRGDRFIKKQHLEFSSKKEAKCFLIKFLLVECLAGTNYTNSELKSTYKKIKKLIKRYSVSSEELPIHPKKQHADKELQNVQYLLQENICKYRKNPS